MGGKPKNVNPSGTNMSRLVLDKSLVQRKQSPVKAL